MKKAVAVIGSNFGDEGKGLITDAYAYGLGGENTLVCRYSGGANAGHTVVTTDSRRHVFGHFGAGTLAGSPTYLSEYFIVNPFLWIREAAELKSKGFTIPKLFIDACAKITTPYEMLLNQFSESSRGTGRHGSCGVGINETVVRSDEYYRLDLYDLGKGESEIRNQLLDIKNEWVPDRLRQLGITLTNEQSAILHNPALVDSFVEAAGAMMKNCEECDEDVFSDFENAIFEGSQGLLLDQDYAEYFPYVTHAKTGLHNVAIIADRAGIKEIEAIYVSRAYMTRHGPGPFLTENSGISHEDKTNQPNPWQGNLRFGDFDYDLIVSAIVDDSSTAYSIDIKPKFAMTCVDQVNRDKIVVVADGESMYMDFEELILKVCNEIGAESGIHSDGPTRMNVMEKDIVRA